MITSITFSTRKPRKQPRWGDRKIINGVEHFRDFARDPFTGACIVSGGKHRWVWKPVVEGSKC